MHNTRIQCPHLLGPKFLTTQLLFLGFNWKTRRVLNAGAANIYDLLEFISETNDETFQELQKLSSVNLLLSGLLLPIISSLHHQMTIVQVSLEAVIN